MPWDIVAFSESQDCGTGALVATITDRFYDQSGDDLNVKPEAPLCLGVGHIGTSTPIDGRLEQAWMEPARYPYFDRAGLPTMGIPRSQAFNDWMARPAVLKGDENLNVRIANTTNERSWVIVFLGNGRITTAMKEAVVPTHRLILEGTTTLTANSWTSVTLTPKDQLEKGWYVIVGMSAGTNIVDAEGLPIAARLVLQAQPGAFWHPGVLISQWGDPGTARVESPKAGAVDYVKAPYEIWPYEPIIGFEHNKIPKVEFLSGTADTYQRVIFELVQLPLEQKPRR